VARLSQLFAPAGYERQLIAGSMESLGTQPRLPAVQEAVDAGSPFSIRKIVALNRMARNEEYYANLPSYSAMTIENTKPFNLSLGSFQETNLEHKRPKYTLDYSRLMIESLFPRYLRQEIIKSIKNELYRDKRITDHNRGAAASIDVDVEWNKGTNRFVISVKGPFWLKFFFYGRRRFIIEGNKANPRSHGMLVFYDPHTGRKIVTSHVVMPEILPGNYVEKAMRRVLNELSDTDKFNSLFDRIYKDHWLSHSGYGDLEKFQQTIVAQLRTVTNRKGQQIYNILNSVGRGRPMTNDVLRTVERGLTNLDAEARLHLQSVVNEYAQKADQESRKAKIEVYDSLRFLLENSVLRLELSDVRGMLPSNLARRSTAATAFRKARAGV